MTTETPSTNSAENKYGTVIEVGQVWADNDSRSAKRTVRVTGLEPGPPIKAVCTVLTDPYGNPPARPKTVRINIDRMHPTSTGYRLLTSSEECSSPPLAFTPPTTTTRSDRGMTGMSEGSDAVPEALTAVLDQHALPAPRDGDCEAVSTAVTAALREQGRSARRAVVTGFLDPDTLGFHHGLGTDTRIIAFLHYVTVCDGLVLDGTARQFDPALPAAWTLPSSDYERELARRLPGITHVTVADATPDGCAGEEPATAPLVQSPVLADQAPGEAMR